MAAAARADSRWLYGPAPDLLLGCGGLYALVFAALAAAGPQIREVLPIGLLPLLVLFTGIPHYGATLLRVYERREDRRRYAIFSVWATLFVYAVFVAGVYDARVGSWMLTVYLLWSPWHYSGQNYGISLMLLRRRGIDPGDAARNWLWASFLFSWLLVALALQGDVSRGSYAPVDVTSDTYRLIRLGIPGEILAPLLAVTGAAYAVSLCAALVTLSRGARLADVSPALAVAALQAIWFSLPVVCRATGLLTWVHPFSDDFGAYVFLWIAMGHSVQYLWVTSYYARASRPEHRIVPYLWKAQLAGGAVWGLPLFLFSPDLLGVRSFDTGLALLVASAVNLQHFVLDGAIWRLRDGAIARVLLRAAVPEPSEAGPPARSWLRPFVWGLGVAYAIATIVGTFEFEVGIRRSLDPPDAGRLRSAAERLRWIGRDSADARYDLGVLALRSGDLDVARAELERSLALGPNARTWIALGSLHERTASWDAALSAYAEALALVPDQVAALARTASLYERRGDRVRAERALRRAVELAPERRDLQRRLARVQRRP